MFFHGNSPWWTNSRRKYVVILCFLYWCEFLAPETQWQKVLQYNHLRWRITSFSLISSPCCYHWMSLMSSAIGDSEQSLLVYHLTPLVFKHFLGIYSWLFPRLNGSIYFLQLSIETDTGKSALPSCVGIVIYYSYR